MPFSDWRNLQNLFPPTDDQRRGTEMDQWPSSVLFGYDLTAVGSGVVARADSMWGPMELKSATHNCTMQLKIKGRQKPKYATHIKHNEAEAQWICCLLPYPIVGFTIILVFLNFLRFNSKPLRHTTPNFAA